MEEHCYWSCGCLSRGSNKLVEIPQRCPLQGALQILFVPPRGTNALQFCPSGPFFFQPLWTQPWSSRAPETKQAIVVKRYYRPGHKRSASVALTIRPLIKILCHCERITSSLAAISPLLVLFSAAHCFLLIPTSFKKAVVATSADIGSILFFNQKRLG